MPGASRALWCRIAAPSSTGSASVASLEGPGVLADDPTLSLVADLAASMDWDAASAAGLTSGLGGAEGAVNQLTVDERLELDRGRKPFDPDDLLPRRLPELQELSCATSDNLGANRQRRLQVSMAMRKSPLLAS